MFQHILQKNELIENLKSCPLDEIFANVIELQDCDDYYCDGDVEVPFDAYTYNLGSVRGAQKFDSESINDLYIDAIKHTKLDNIIKDIDVDSVREDLWILADSWKAKGIRISDEGLKELYHSTDENRRLEILERAIEACQLAEWKVISRQIVKLTRGILRFEREGF